MSQYIKTDRNDKCDDIYNPNNPFHKEFEEFLHEIHNSFSSIDSEGIKLIVLVLVEKNNKACFYVYCGDKIWIDTLNIGQFQAYKKNMGFDGGWKPFFQTMKLALNRVQGGNISIKLPKSKKVIKILTK